METFLHFLISVMVITFSFATPISIMYTRSTCETYGYIFGAIAISFYVSELLVNRWKVFSLLLDFFSCTSFVSLG